MEGYKIKGSTNFPCYIIGIRDAMLQEFFQKITATTPSSVPDAPINGATNRAPEVRRYSLEQANYLRTQLRLYLRITDAADARVERHAVGRRGQLLRKSAQPRFLDVAEGMGLERGLSDDTARRIDAAVRGLVDEAYARAGAILADRRALLDEGAARLLAQETLTEADLTPMAAAARQAAAPTATALER